MSSKTRYSVFISSTYTDLKDERAQAIRAVLELGHIPIGMEMFNAADDTQWQYITREIDEVDYYVVIVAHRYGSTTEEGLSFTEKEYNYAIDKRVPVLGFVIDDVAEWPEARSDQNDHPPGKLDAFKRKVRSKMSDSWVDASSLHAKVGFALMKQMNLVPRTGWRRGHEQIDSAVIEELARLSEQNSSLQKQLSTAHESLRNIQGQAEISIAQMSQILDRAEYDVIVSRSSTGYKHSKAVLLVNLAIGLAQLSISRADSISVNRASSLIHDSIVAEGSPHNYDAIDRATGQPIAQVVLGDLAMLGIIRVELGESDDRVVFSSAGMRLIVARRFAKGSKSILSKK